MYKESRLYNTDVGFTSNAQPANPDDPNYDKKKKRKRRQAISPLDDDENGLIRKHKYFIPTSPLGIALEICILANMDKRQVLPSLDTVTAIETYYNGPFLFDKNGDGTGDDCSTFLPNIFSGGTPSLEDLFIDRNFGPSSSNVKR